MKIKAHSWKKDFVGGKELYFLWVRNSGYCNNYEAFVPTSEFEHYKILVNKMFEKDMYGIKGYWVWFLKKDQKIKIPKLAPNKMVRFTEVEKLNGIEYGQDKLHAICARTDNERLFGDWCSSWQCERCCWYRGKWFRFADKHGNRIGRDDTLLHLTKAEFEMVSRAVDLTVVHDQMNEEAVRILEGVDEKIKLIEKDRTRNDL